MENQSKITINTTQENVSLGNQVIKLIDETRFVFKTEDPESFKNFLGETKDVSLYYKGGVVVALIDDPNIFQAELAYLNLKKSNPMEKLESIANASCSIDSFESFLRYMKCFGDDSALKILSSIRDLKIHKATKVERRKDNAGNYAFSVSRESAGKDEFTPPKKVQFCLPVFENINIDKEFEFEFVFDFSQNGDNVSLSYMLENPMFREIFEKHQREILEMVIEDIHLPKYYGMVIVNKQTNLELMKLNKLTIKER